MGSRASLARLTAVYERAESPDVFFVGSQPRF
jgi:hypothetical protein